jgi:hypothetical protein
MIHADEDYEGLERVQLEDYNDYLLDPFGEDVDATMDSVSPASIKADDADDIQKERRRLINAKHTQRRHRVVETNQQGSGNLHDSSMGDLCAIINAGRDTCNVIIATQQEREEVEAHSSTRYQLPLDYLEITRKCKPKTGEQSTRRKKTLSLKERFEVALYGQCPWHPKSKHSAFECETLWRDLGARPNYEERRRNYPNNDLLIN